MLVIFALVLLLVVSAVYRPSIFTHSMTLPSEVCLTEQQRSLLEADADARNDHAPVSISKPIRNELGLGPAKVTIPVVYRREISKGIAWLPSGGIFLIAVVSSRKNEASSHYFHMSPDGRIKGVCRVRNHVVRPVALNRNAVELARAEIDFWRGEADQLVR